MDLPVVRRHPALLTAATVGIAVVLRHRREEERRVERVAAAALEALLNAVDANDHQTGAHVRRVATYALILARAAGLSERERRQVERTALFHDIGKIHAALFDIVHEGTRLAPHEQALIATHPRKGAAVLAPLAAFYPDLAEGVLSHHERWDGTGYPRHLAGEAIPVQARIVAIADSFDAITHVRRYSREHSLDEAQRAIEAGRGTQFDPALVDRFLSPPVFGAVRRAVRAERAPRIVRHDRRHRQPDRAPDIKFRWRRAASARRPPGRARS